MEAEPRTALPYVGGPLDGGVFMLAAAPLRVGHQQLHEPHGVDVASELPYGFWHRYVLHRNDDGWHYDYAGTLGAHAPGGR